MRPADNLPPGKMDASGGLAVNSFGEVLPVVRGAIGITPWLEAGLQYEIYSLMGDLRLGILHSETDGIALAVGLQGGLLTRAVSSRSSATGGGLGPFFVVGRKWERWEIYLGGKAFTDLLSYPAILSGRLGGRFYIVPSFFLGLEGGATGHFWGGSSNVLAEGTLYGGLAL